MRLLTEAEIVEHLWSGKGAPHTSYAPRRGAWPSAVLAPCTMAQTLLPDDPIHCLSV